MPTYTGMSATTVVATEVQGPIIVCGDFPGQGREQFFEAQNRRAARRGRAQVRLAAIRSRRAADRAGGLPSRGLPLRVDLAQADGREALEGLPCEATGEPWVSYNSQRAARYHRRYVAQGVERDARHSREEEKGRGHNTTKRNLRESCGLVSDWSDEPPGVSAKNGKLHYRGLLSCRSVWACAVCCDKIRGARGTELERACQAFERKFPDGMAVLVTATVPHASTDPLATTLDAVQKAWSAGVCSGRAWMGDKRNYGVLGQVRATEIMAGGRAGFHPHQHILIFLDRKLSKRQLQAFRRRIYGRWADALVKRGLPAPTYRRGVHVDRVKASDGGAYVVKAEGDRTKNRRVALEVARGDIKAGSGGSVTPFELLDRYDDARQAMKRAEAVSAKPGASSAALRAAAHAYDEADRVRASSLAAWDEYTTATKGRQCMRWSRGLRKLLLGDGDGDGGGDGDGDGVSDEELDFDEVPDGEFLDGDPDELPPIPDGPVFTFASADEVRAVRAVDRGRGPALLLDLLEQRLWDDARRFAARACERYWWRGWCHRWRQIWAEGVDVNGRSGVLLERIEGQAGPLVAAQFEAEMTGGVRPNAMVDQLA